MVCYGMKGGLLHNSQLPYLMWGGLYWKQGAAAVVVVVTEKHFITVQQHNAWEREREREKYRWPASVRLSVHVGIPILFVLVCLEALHENQYGKPQGCKKMHAWHIYFVLMLTCASDVVQGEILNTLWASVCGHFCLPVKRKRNKKVLGAGVSFMIV